MNTPETELVKQDILLEEPEAVTEEVVLNSDEEVKLDLDNDIASILNGQTIPEYELNLEMIKAQDRLNRLTMGDDWYSNVSKNGKIANWWLCISSEAFELVGSFNWKHWKDVDGEPVNKDNVKVELVDIFHFLLSLFISNGVLGLTEHVRKLIEAGELEESEGTTREAIIAKVIDDIAAMLSYENYVANNIEVLSEYNSDYNNILNLAYSITKLETADDIVAHVFAIMNVIDTVDGDMKYEDLYKLYMGKCCLNIFRQENGYAEGTYIKTWDVEGNEDNVYMLKLLENTNISTLTEETIRIGLSVKYAEVLAASTLPAIAE